MALSFFLEESLLNSRTALIFLFSCFCVTQSFAGNLTITPTTTLSAQTGNNTSAANTFTGLPNGDPKPGNVSKLPIRDLVPGYNGKILAHYMPWWGNTGHINIGYSTHDSAQAERTVKDMISRGYDGVMVTEANSNSWDQTGALTMFAAVVNHPGFLFAISQNKGAFSGTTDPTSRLIANMTFSYQHYFQSPNYLRVNGHPVVFIFDTISGLDYAKAKAYSPGSPIFIFRNSSGFTPSYSNGAFSWIGLPSSTDPTGFGYLDNFYKASNTYSAKVAVGSFWKGFDDSVASWTQHRLAPQKCGTTWLNSLGRVRNFLSNPPEILKVATWNDYEEGTEVETGIDNCASVHASVSNGVLSFGPSFSSSTGTEATVDHYQVYISQDGQNLMKLAELPTGSRSLTLSSYSLAAGTYYIYVQMVAKPGILNRMSPAVAYKVGTGTTAPSTAATVTLSWPTDNYPNAAQWIEVRASAQSTAPITAMAIQVDGKTALTVNNVSSLDRWVFGSVGSWHYIQAMAYTNGAWVRSATVKAYVSH
jgi:hypothetical protein